MSDDIYPEDAGVDITPIVEQWSDERWEVAIERAMREMGGIVADEDMFINEIAEQLKKMVMQDSLRDLVAKGYLREAGVDEHGEILYEGTEKGFAAVGLPLPEDYNG